MARSKKTEAPAQEATRREDTFRSYNRVELTGPARGRP